MTSVYRYFLVTMLLFGATSAFAQEAEIIDLVEEALKSSSSREISKHLHNKVEIKLDGERNEYSKNQAEVVLKQFFQDNTAESCEFVHQGNNNAGGIIYAIGSYQTASVSYRVVVRAKKFSKEFKVYRLEFTKER
ncbi:DUF4783 domain-containing protein [Roseivirga pacifica]|nr:DUF4783 domain-containing protein [Roseivirga pacifica]MCO6365290.1 DUF4783 domain-containing protein [Roseivirga pacifica]MCO6371980.1 DUF4783 domain-containing protein [Roseivirga pacifica]MCO6375909.1 DUF4783 domain-containing protein [Roseivirga pacifica]MCO6379358.1 DUF4783 domain-containing protein [Roseivirga pacifica]